ncbi:MAG TPA: hypothetical protein VMI06_06375 [Terriglobia bacterium]|nr:hypothetical protein [Terriglobia bacterium]
MTKGKLAAYGLVVAVAALVCLGGGSGTARANDIKLDVTATLAPTTAVGTTGGACSLTCTLGGTLVINNTLGTIVSSDITMSGESPSVGSFTNPSGVGSAPVGFINDVALVIFNGPLTTTTADVDLVLDTTSLVGYDGGGILPEESEVFGPFVSTANVADWAFTSPGALRPASTTVPEPGTFPLLAVGLLGSLVLLWVGGRHQLCARRLVHFKQ